MAETVLVTGGSGFIGSAVVRHLTSYHADRFRVVTLGAVPHDSVRSIVVRRDGRGCYIGLGEALSAAELGVVDHVIHAGAFTPKYGAMASVVDGNTSNVVNTLALMRALTNAPRKIVFVSTLDVYGSVVGLIDETTPVAPTSLYGLSKLYGERMLAAAAAEPLFASTMLQIVRLGHIYGPGEAAYQKFIPVTIERLLRGEPPILMTNGAERRAFLYIDDCARMIVAALDLAPGQPVVNLASANIVSIGAMADMLSQVVDDLTGLHVPPERRGTAPGSDAVFDVSLMQRLFGPERTNLADGLRREVAAMMAPA